MWEFKLSSIEDLRNLGRELNAPVDAIEDVSILSKPVQAGGLLIPNSLAVHPMEGCDGDSQGRPGKLTLRRYGRFAAGGAGLIWGEATAVVPEGRANPRQLLLVEKNRESYIEMIKMMRQAAHDSMGPRHQPVIVAQLTHSGRYSKPEGAAAPIIGQRDPYRDPLIPQAKPDPDRKSRIPDDWPPVTDEYLDKLQDSYVEAARRAFEVGFDAVDIKSCHGYLINELLACHKRKGKYGGSFENRTRFLLEVIDKIRDELGDETPITTRIGIYDAIPYPYGWAVDKDDYTKPDLTEPKKLFKLLEQRGVKLINITIANPYYNPHVGRPFNEPIIGGYDEPEHPLVGVNRLISITGEIQKQFPDIAMVGTGYSWLRTLMPNVAAAARTNGMVTLIGGGRMSFAYPDFAKDILRTGRMYPEKVCVACSACTQIMRDGGMAGCVVRDNKVYGPIFEHGRMSDKDNLIRLAAECRKCQEPTCQVACPAGIQIPKFITLFLDGQEKEAYQVIRQSNIFPEVCAWLCPVEHQCEGNCLQGFIGDGPLPIADIQRYLAVQANRNGWSKLQIPRHKSGKNIAVIGAGPAGLSCAAGLLEAGHTVTIFDRNTELGGMIESVIPPDRQSDALANEIAAVFSDVPKDRMILRLGEELSDGFNLDNVIEENFAAVFIGMGLPKSVGIDGGQEDIKGLYNAMEFLSMAKKPGLLDIVNKRVAVTGGGNTAMDVAVTAKQLGAQDVYVIYRRSFKEMPAWDSDRERAMNEGVHFLILTQPLKYNSANGRLRSITVCPTRLGEPDSTGRRKPHNVETSSYELDMDIAVEAIGQQSPEQIESILPQVELANGLIVTKDGKSATSRPGVFAGGDLVRGASTVVGAVADGMKAAKEINEYLKH
jgi:2,4-dienoyl-CoA reductase (NADPH2)